MRLRTRTASDLDRHAQLRRRRAGVLRHFVVAGPERPPRHGTEQRRPSADADREVRRAGAPALAVAHERLHDPVFERVEADHREASSRPEHLQGRRQRALERSELVVDGDAQRLEDALRRMSAAEALRSRYRRTNDVYELKRGRDRAPANDRARDLPRIALLAVALEDVGELTLGRIVDQIRPRYVR